MHEQARLPLFAPNEMANGDEEEIVARLSRGNQAAHFRRVFGEDIFVQPRRAFKALLLALEVFQQSPADFYPFRSKYDEFLRGKAQLTQAETRGLELFNDAAKGNCASCHPSSVNRGAFPLFTDFGYVALGVPRNQTLAANSDAEHFDMGLCGPIRTDLAGRAEYCGLFRVPTLRNVALRETFFHNGSVRILEDAIRFYAQRDSHPEKWYPQSRDNTVRKFDDLPLKYHGNINREPPFGNSASDGSRLSDQEIADIAAFLRTLTDADLIR
jgi:cytochrome c peroxidase